MNGHHAPEVTDEAVKRGADALATWVNPTWRIGWAEIAARVVLDAALTKQQNGSSPQPDNAGPSPSHNDAQEG